MRALLLQFVTPNQRVEKNPRTAMIVMQAMFLFMLWVESPFVFLPKPGEVVTAFVDLWNQGLANELITSFTLNIETILVGTILSLVLSWMSLLQFFRPWIEVIGKLRFLSMVGLTFFFTLMTANGHQLKLAMLVFSISVFFITGMADVLSSIPREQWDLARVLHMGPWQAMYEVVILGQTDRAFDVLRQNVAISWMMMSFAESMSRSNGGIGAMLSTQNRYFHLPEIFAIQLMVLGVGLLQDWSLGVMKNLCCPYASLVIENR